MVLHSFAYLCASLMRFVGEIFSALRWLASLVIATAVCAGCNSRVFVERTEPDTDLITLGPEGGTAEFHFSSGDWWISDVIINGHKAGCTVVVDGERTHIDQPELSGVGTLIMDKVGAVECAISRKDRRRLVVMLPLNTSDADTYISVWTRNDVLKWDLGVRQPHLTYPEVEKIGCALAKDSEETTLDEGWIFKVDNSGTASGSVRKKVFDKCFRMVDIRIEQTTLPSTDWDSIMKMTGGKIRIPIPEGIPNDGKLVFGDGTALFVPGEQYIEYAMPDTEVELETKPGKYTYQMLWEYLEYDAEFHLYLKSADGQYSATVDGTIHSRTPDGQYYVTIEQDGDGGSDGNGSTEGGANAGNVIPNVKGIDSDLARGQVEPKCQTWP